MGVKLNSFILRVCPNIQKARQSAGQFYLLTADQRSVTVFMLVNFLLSTFIPNVSSISSTISMTSNESRSKMWYKCPHVDKTSYPSGRSSFFSLILRPTILLKSSLLNCRLIKIIVEVFYFFICQGCQGSIVECWWWRTKGRGGIGQI